MVVAQVSDPFPRNVHLVLFDVLLSGAWRSNWKYCMIKSVYFRVGFI